MLVPGASSEEAREPEAAVSRGMGAKPGVIAVLAAVAVVLRADLAAG